VILVRNLELAMSDYAALGFTVVPGGEHTDGATHNALIGFADESYLELIAFTREAPAHRWWRHMAAGEGLIDFALWPDEIGTVIAAARSRGLALDGPTPGGRMRPDGQQVAWQMGMPTQGEDLPFLCADVTPRSLRVPEARQHANHVTGIARVTVAVHDVAASTTHYRALLSTEPETTTQGPLFHMDGSSIALAHGPAGSLAGNRLVSRGEGICALALRSPDQFSALDLHLAHGAQISFMP
jgi:hypothetical protein